MNRALVFILLALPLTAQQADPDVDNPLERARWFFGQRADPDGSLRAADRLRAFRLVERMRQSQVAAASVGRDASAADWTLIGPQPTEPPPGSTAGRVSGIAVDQRDTTV